MTRNKEKRSYKSDFVFYERICNCLFIVVGREMGRESDDSVPLGSGFTFHVELGFQLEAGIITPSQVLTEAC